jgi:hypothetical protein
MSIILPDNDLWSQELVDQTEPFLDPTLPRNWDRFARDRRKFFMLGQCPCCGCPCKTKYWKANINGFFDSISVTGGSCASYNGVYVVGPGNATCFWPSRCGPPGGATCTFGGLVPGAAILQWYPNGSSVTDNQGHPIPNGPGGVWVLRLNVSSENPVFYKLNSSWNCTASNVMIAAVSSGTGCCVDTAISATLSPTTTDCLGHPLP